MKTKKTPRSGFTLIELLTVIAIIGILAAILIPTVGAVKKKAAQITSSANLKQIAIGYSTFSNSGTRTRVIPSSGTSRFVATTPARWAEVIAEFGDLNDAPLYFISSADDVAGQPIPKIILDNNDSPVAQWTAASSYISYSMAAGISANASATTTPIIWTKGLGAGDEEWAADSPWLGDGGHIAFADGHVEFLQDTLGEDGTGAFINPTTSTPTTSIADALGSEGVVLEVTGN